MPTPVLAVLGALLGLIVEHLTHRRSAAQPLAQDQEAERRLLAAAQDRLGLATAVGLPTEAFTLAGHRSAWKALLGFPAVSAVDSDVTADAAVVRACFEDREMFPSRTPLVEVDGTLRRLPPRVGLIRRILTAALAAGGFAAASGVFTGWALAAACVVVLTALAIALVDIDTLLIDLGAYLFGYGTAIALLVVDLVVAGDLFALGVSFGLGLGSALLLFGFIAVYSRLRGIHAMGFGDILLYAAAGTTALLATGDAMALYYTLLYGAAAGLVTWMVTAVTYRGTGSRLRLPFPFGPGLALGAFVAMLLL